MASKLLITIIIVTVSIRFLSACKKMEVVQTDSVQTPLSYYSPKINGAHNWSGTYQNYLNNYTADTNFRFALKTVSDSIVIVDLPNRVETLHYYETDEIAKTILFNGRYDDSNYYSFSLYLTYCYAADSMIYEEYYYQNPYGFNITNISNMILHSP